MNCSAASLWAPIRTKSPEIQLTELLPLHAKIADKFSIVRSVYHTAAAVHDVGVQVDVAGAGQAHEGGGAAG